MKGCLFCKKYETKEISYFGESRYFWYHLDQFPITPGHSEIIPKKHIVSLMDLTEEEWADLRPAVQDVVYKIENELNLKKFYEKILKNPFSEKSAEMMIDAINSPFINRKPDAYNHGNNDGEAAGRTIHHLHWHVIPRYFGDVLDPRGGIRYIIPDKANYKK
jgi:histidine triad (HIT) family protein